MDVSKMSVAELKAEARKRGVKGFSTMKKAQLVTVLAGDAERGIAPAKPKRKRDIDEGTKAKDIAERRARNKRFVGVNTKIDVRTPAGRRKREIVEKIIPLLAKEGGYNSDHVSRARKTGKMLIDGSGYDFAFENADAEMLKELEAKHGKSPVKGIEVKPDGSVKVMKKKNAPFIEAPKAGGGAKPAKRVVKKKKPTAGGGARAKAPKKISDTIIGSISQEKIYKR